MLGRFQRLARAFLMIGIVLSALVFWRGTQDAFNLVKLTALGVSILASFALLASWSAERRKWIPGFVIGYAALAFLGAYGIATYFSRNPWLSLAGRYHRYIGFVQMSLWVLAVFTIVGLYWEKPKELSGVARAFAVALIVLAGYVLLQAAGLDWLNLRNPGGDKPPYPIGSLGNSNFAGGYLGLGLPLLIYLSVKGGRGGGRDFWMAAAGLCVLALWLTQSRGGMIAAACALGAMGLVYRDMVPRAARGFVGAVVLAGVISAVLIVWHPGSDELPGPLADMAVFQTKTLEARTAYWQTAIEMFKERPLIGQGPDLFYTLYPRYRSAEDGAKVALLIPDEPHNIFLQHLAYSGLLGAGAYALVIVLALGFGYKAARERDGPHRLEAAAFLGVLAGYLGQGMVSIDVPPLAFTGWLAIAAIAVVADPRLRAARDRRAAAAESEPAAGESELIEQKKPFPRMRPRVVFHLLVFALLTAAVIFSVRPVTADIKIRDGLRLIGAKGSLADAASKFEQAIRIAPWEPIYRSQAGGLAQRLGTASKDVGQRKLFYTVARQRYDEALVLEPDNLFYVIYIARLNSFWTGTVDAAMYPEADRWWLKAVSLDPTNWKVRQERATFLNSYSKATKDPDAASKAAEEFARIKAIKARFDISENGDGASK